MIKVLGLMTCFNRKEKTLNSIKKLMEGNPSIEFDFIVVDDNSKDGTVEALKKYQNITIIQGTGSLFYCGGMRLAIEQAQQRNSYEYCLLFNDDVDFYPNSIEKLIHLADNKTIWVGATCDEKGLLSYGGKVSTSKFRPRFKTIKSEKAEGEECDTFNANCVLVPWGIFVELGNMDEAYSHSMSDLDYGFTAKKRGITVKVASHYVGFCVDNPIGGGWRDKSLPLLKRIKLKESPKGLPTKEWFHFLNKNYNIVTAFIYTIIPYIRIFIGR